MARTDEIGEYQGVVRMDFPSNSKSKAVPKQIAKKISPTSADEKKVARVTKGKVVRKKKGFGKKMAESFFNEEIDNIGQYIINDVLIPGAKTMIYDAFMNSLGMSLFGQAMPKNLQRNGSRSIVNYAGVNKQHAKPTISQKARANHEFDDIILEDRYEAESVLSRMVDMIEEYTQVTVADLYDMVGITGSFADHKYGWTNLASSSVRRDREGYILVLPRTEVL